MIKTINGNYGTCYFCDLFNTERGLPSLDKIDWDLGLTDPPYNIGKGIIQRSVNSRLAEIIYYPDKMKPEKYQQFSKDWFDLLKKKTNRIVFTPGTKNEDWWKHTYYSTEPKIRTIYSYNRGRGAEQINAKLSLHEPVLTWNINKNTGKFKFSIYEFHSRKQHPLKKKLNHPCPKDERLWRVILTELTPTSVVDCFMGSGTTAQLCEEFGIRWVGFEREEQYMHDIELRINYGMKKHKLVTKQTKLFN